MDIYSKCFDRKKSRCVLHREPAVGVSLACTVCNSSSLSRSGDKVVVSGVPAVIKGTHYCDVAEVCSVSCMRMRVVTRVISSLLFFGGRRFFYFPVQTILNQKRKELLVWKTTKSIQWDIFSHPKDAWNGQRRTALTKHLYGVLLTCVTEIRHSLSR